MNPEAIFKKLRLNDGQMILIVDPPKEFSAILKGLTYDRQPSPKKRATYDFIQIFATRQAALEKAIKEMKGAGKHDCVFWACYPKGAGSIKSDISRETVWRAFTAVGMKTVTQIALDDTWSAMRARPADKVGT